MQKKAKHREVRVGIELFHIHNKNNFFEYRTYNIGFTDIMDTLFGTISLSKNYA